ncbi:Prolyl 4-hydroxylase, alpha subunit [Pleurostoma richardsiae]|uniref:Prolyl 4-hydroxylase, alpha subunit n=1 Tax=Pleurostoma richardsiae TaxID=41990 RepID=A0AA38S328_9PEZI|nr:Prolyl 4-hydroxylase, alpha subunit [Pleurostoma richardsiae]
MAKDKRDKATKAGSTSKLKASETAIAASAPLLWPAFKPPLPLIDLALEELVPGKVVIIRNFWPKSLCRDYVSFLKTLPLAQIAGKPKRGMAPRQNDRFQVDDPQFSTRLWLETGLREALLAEDIAQSWGGDVVGLSPNIRVYRYSKGQFFDCHYDDSNSLTVQSDTLEKIPAKTTWTLLLYLTSAAEGCIGGETVFYPNDSKSPRNAIAVPPETGMLLLHKHGDDCMLHEGAEVTAGEKWVLRSDLCVRR